MNEDRSRIRINAKQTAKGFWQLDCTVELDSDVIKIEDEKDFANTSYLHIGDKLLETVKKTEEKFRADGRVIVGDKPE